MKGVNLETLEQEEMNNEVGWDFGEKRSYANGNALLAMVMPVNGTYSIGRICEYYYR